VENRSLTCHALRIRQGEGRPIYLFSLSAGDISQLADTTYLSRNASGELTGYQRSTSKSQVRDIVDYLGESEALMPNSLTLALSPSATFEATSEGGSAPASGLLHIPLAQEEKGEKPNRIVDGQQRLTALMQAGREDFSLPVGAFISEGIGMEREQFVRINGAKNLPRGLVTELLPTLGGPLPPSMEKRKAPSKLCEWLSRDGSSPFCGLIRRASTPRRERKQAVVSDTPLISVIQESLSSPSGCLFRYHNLATGEVDFDGAQSVLRTYWTGVKNTFPDAWGKPPKRSRLMHTAGLRVMGRLMDHVMPTAPHADEDPARQVERELQQIAPACHWTGGRWEVLGGVRWNDLKASAQHVNRLVEHFKALHIRSYDDHATQAT